VSHRLLPGGDIAPRRLRAQAQAACSQRPRRGRGPAGRLDGAGLMHASGGFSRPCGARFTDLAVARRMPGLRPKTRLRLSARRLGVSKKRSVSEETLALLRKFSLRGPLRRENRPPATGPLPPCRKGRKAVLRAERGSQRHQAHQGPDRRDRARDQSSHRADHA
jgi:hypothetical protein